MRENCCGTCNHNRYDTDYKCYVCGNEDAYECGLPTEYTDCCDDYEEKVNGSKNNRTNG